MKSNFNNAQQAGFIKKLLIKCKSWLYLLASLFPMFIYNNSEAAVYFSRAAGNWNATATWSTTGYGGAAAASTPGSAAGDVVLLSGYAVTVTATPANAILSITISQNNNTGNDTRLNLNTAGTTLTSNSIAVTDNNRDDHMDIEISSTAILQVNGSVSITRGTTNDRNKRLRVYLSNSGRMNVTGNFTYTFNRARNGETNTEIQLDNSSRLDVNGNMNLTIGNNYGDDNHFDFTTSSSAICNVGGALNATVSNSDDKDQICFTMTGGTFIVTGAVTNTVAGTATDDNTILYSLSNAASLSTGAFTYSHLGRDENNTKEIALSNTASMTVNGNFTASFGHDGGGSTKFEIEMNNTAAMNITGNASLTLQTCDDGDDLLMDLNGGSFVVNGTMTATILNTATNGNNYDLNIDGGSMTTGAFTINHNGGSSGDVNLWLNNGSTASASSLQVNGALTLNHTSGDNMYLEVNSNSTLNVTGAFSATLTNSSDGDIIYAYFNGGTSTFNSMLFDIASGATSSNHLYWTLDGGTVNVTNNATIRHQGGGGSGDVNLWLNRTSTANPSVLNINGDLILTHSGGDNMEIEMNNNATATIGDDLIDTLTSSDGDDFLFDINGGTMYVRGDFNHVITSPSGTTEDLDLRIDGSGRLDVDGSVNVIQNAGGQIIMYVNNASGTTGQFNVGGDLTITHYGPADGVYLEFNQSSLVTVDGNLTINNNAANDDIARIRVQNSTTFTVSGNLTMNLLSGLTTRTDNCLLDLNGGTTTVGRNLVMNGSSGNDATITVDGNGTVLNVTDTLQLNHSGGDLSYVYFGNGTGSPTASLGALRLNDSGGSTTSLRLWNSSICTVGANVVFSALAGGQVDIATYSSSSFRMRGNLIRGALPNRFGVISSATGSTFHYNGTSGAQTIAGDVGSGGDAIAYSNIVLNNTSGANPAFLMTATEGTATIPSSSNLTFTNGIVSSNSSAYFIISNSATVSGANNNSYVDGPIRKVGNQSFTFPIGQNNSYQPATISAPSTNTHHFTAEYRHSNPNSPYSITSKDASLDHISNTEYWIVNRTNGASNVTITLGWNNNSGGVTNLANLRVARWDGTVWRDHNNGGTSGNTTSGTVVSSGSITSFAATSPFTLASSTSSNPLPVSLIKFDAFRLGNKVSISWSTASEKDNDYFTVERSKDGISFEELTKITGAGNSNQLKSYASEDNLPLNGSSYYRLKQVDYNGEYAYSSIKSVRFDESTSTSQFSVFPNPSKGVFIKVKLKESMLQTVQAGNNIGVDLFDLNGSKVFSTNNLIVEDSNEGIVKFNNALQPGIYAITFTSDQTVDKQFVVIE